MSSENNNLTNPPRLAERFLLWFLKEELAEEVLGDLEEKYIAQLEQTNKRKARLNYWYQVVNYLRPFAIRSNLLIDLNPFFMFNNHLKIAWRNFFKQKLNSFINVTGMTIGMTTFILIALYIQYESSYDQQHENADRIYRVVQQQKGNEFRGTDKFAVAPVPLGPSMVKQIPEVETSTTITTLQDLFLHNGETFYETGLYADEFLFDVFTYPVIQGNVKSAIKNPKSIILTESFSQRFFGNESPIGKQITLANGQEFIVEALIEDIPGNQHFDFEYIVSIENYGEYISDRDRWRWDSNNYWVYVLLQEGVDYKSIEKKMIIFDGEVNKGYASSGWDFRIKYFFQPLQDIYLRSNINMEAKPTSDIRYIYMSASVAFIILILALINYMNLASARFRQRAKEIGVRKVLGAKRGNLVNQFMMESILITILSFALAIGFARLLLPEFNELLGKSIPFNIGENRIILYCLLFIALFLGGISGLYPAILSSALAPVKALKGNWFGKRKNGAFFRNTLVVGQFTAAIVLGISAMIIYQQLQFIQNKKIGYNRDQVVYVQYRNQRVYEKMDILRAELIKNPNIEHVSIANVLPLNSSNQGIVRRWEGNTDQRELGVYRLRTDYDFVNLFEMDIVEGRNFSRENPSDTASTYLLNEAATKALGWETAVGKTFLDGKVIGVVKDFHFQPFSLSIKPMYLTFMDANYARYFGNVIMKVKMNEHDNTMAHIQKSFKSVFPKIPFDLRYMDDSYAQLYGAEQRFGKAFTIFTLIALFIACMGLFGLVTHTVLLRTKEIGIRKVLGASVSDIVGMISKDFMKLVMVASLLSFPLAWWGMHQWLQDFAYRIEIDFSVFVSSSIVAIGIAFFTVGIRAARAAWMNPVEAIGEE